MPFPKNKFSKSSVEILQRKNVFKGFFRMEKITLKHRLFSGSWSEPLERELMLRGEAVGVIPYDPVNQQIGLIEQFRVGAIDSDKPWLFELVAGMRDLGESPEQAARREMLEESGVSVSELSKICEYWVSPGGMDEKLHLYCAICDLTNAEGVYGLGDEHEDIRFHVLQEDDAFEAMEKGLCNNSATIIALLWLQKNRLKWAK